MATQESQTKQPDEMYCTSCRALIKRGVQFCTQCGTRVGGAQTASREVGKLGAVWQQRDRRPIGKRLGNFAREHTLAFVLISFWFVITLLLLAATIWLQIVIEQESDDILKIAEELQSQGRHFESIQVLISYEKRDNVYATALMVWGAVAIGGVIVWAVAQAVFRRNVRDGNIQENGPPN
ncbi:MAG: zinc ribbon domain-containing protein [Nitrospiraceae bacterium]